MAERIETFAVDRRGDLVRQVVPARGRPYEHRCRLVSFEEVLWAAVARGDGGFTLSELAADAAVPHTQAAVALAFLKERSAVVVDGRRSYPASRALREDGLLQYHALREAAAE